MGVALNLAGMRFGKLVVIRQAEHKGKYRMGECICDCGKTKVVEAGNLRSGASKACGNCRTPTSAAFKPVHGASVDKGPTYESWRSMRRRVARPDERPSYRGITIDPAWDDFATFLKDMGERPAGKTIDRIDGTKGYSKGNCRWATPVQQTRNRRTARTFTSEGRTMPIIEWAREYGISYGAAIYRIDKYGSLRLPDGYTVRPV